MSDTAPVLNLADFDRSVRPADDLFRFVNGTWLKTAVIDDDKPGAGAFVELRDAAEAAVRDIITGIDGGAPGSDEARIADLYAAFMDADRVEELGLEPLRPRLTAISRATSPSGLLRLCGELAAAGARSLVGVDADSDPGDPGRCVMFVGQGGLGLPDEAYYREDVHAGVRAEYVAHVERTLALAGFADDAADAARAVMQLETDIAALHWDKVRCRDMKQMYNLQTWDEFRAASDLDWDAFCEGAGLPTSAVAEVVNCQPSFFTDVAALVTDDRLDAWRWWARFALVSSFSPYLPQAFVDERFRFYGTVLSGTPTNRERWKRGVALVEGALGEAVGRLYVERHFSPDAKERMDELVANLVEAYRRSISSLDWMTEETRAEALKKLAAFTPKIGFPATWRDYSALEVDRDDLVGNVVRANRFELDRAIAKAGNPVDRDEWFMTPQTVNAYYHPLRNEIVFPAAILQPPFFNVAADDAVNYGGIGAVIGHEIGHGFDDQGSTCDGDGRLRDWWTDDDRSAFEERTRSLVDQYAVLSPEGADGQTVNGELTIGENIGDLGGLGIAYKAWQIAQEGSPSEATTERSPSEATTERSPGEATTERSPSEAARGRGEEFTSAQRLFLSWAAVWQAKFRPEAVKQRLATDPHSPNEFRCNQIVRNVDAFYDAFGVSEGDRLWLAPTDRVTIW